MRWKYPTTRPLIESVMGIDLTVEELMTLGRRSRNLEKAFNTLHTELARKDDLPPLRYQMEPIPSGPYKGERADIDKWNGMLDEFYELHGWDVNTGLQTGNGLRSLSMEDVAEKLARAGKLIES